MAALSLLAQGAVPSGRRGKILNCEGIRRFCRLLCGGAALTMVGCSRKIRCVKNFPSRSARAGQHSLECVLCAASCGGCPAACEALWRRGCRLPRCPPVRAGAVPKGRQGKIWKRDVPSSFGFAACCAASLRSPREGAASFTMARRSFGGAGADCGFALLAQGAVPKGRRGRNWSCAGIRAFIASAQRGGIASLAAGEGLPISQWRGGYLAARALVAALPCLRRGPPLWDGKEGFGNGTFFLPSALPLAARHRSARRGKVAADFTASRRRFARRMCKSTGTGAGAHIRPRRRCKTSDKEAIR